MSCKQFSALSLALCSRPSNNIKIYKWVHFFPCVVKGCPLVGVTLCVQTWPTAQETVNWMTEARWTFCAYPHSKELTIPRWSGSKATWQSTAMMHPSLAELADDWSRTPAGRRTRQYSPAEWHLETWPMSVPWQWMWNVSVMSMLSGTVSVVAFNCQCYNF